MLATLFGLMLAACGGGGDPPAGPATPALQTAAAKPQPTVAQATASATVPGVGAAPAAPAAVDGRLRFSFQLDAARRTSAGVYAADGSLVRTLWRGEELAAGSHVRDWDQRADDGSAAGTGEYTVRLVHHNLRYVWDGVVGNSSARGGRAPFKSYRPVQDLAVDGLQVHLGLGYNEAQSALQGFDVRDPQRPAPRVNHLDPFVGLGLVASDGTHLYAANTGGISKAGFVVAFTLATGAQVAFSAGEALCLNRRADGGCYPAQAYAGVAALRPAGEPMPGGLAAQRQGTLLAVAYAEEGLVRVFDKRSGSLRTQFRAALAAQGGNRLAFSADGDLWVLGETTVRRYTALDTEPRLVQVLEGFARPLALAPDPADDGAVWVADGGAVQQLRRFGGDGAVTAVIGQRGGMAGRAAVAADRLCFATVGTQERSALGIDALGHLWVLDSCNNRLLRFTASGDLLDTLAYLPAVYAATVDGNDPRRVFANFLEFEIDYGRELSSSGGWRLVRNWLPALPAALRDAASGNEQWSGLGTVHTLANGRTYGMMGVSGRSVLVELTAAGTVREAARLAAQPQGRSPWVFYASGELGYAADEGDRQVVYRLPLTGFDSDGNPRWALPARAIASVPLERGAPTHRMGTFTGITGPRHPVTAGGKVIFFNAAVAVEDGFHLGAVAVGGSGWSWRASRSGALDGRGSFQSRGVDASIHYGGNVVLAEGRSVLYGYHGEFYTDLGNGRVGQANQFMHFLDNGLFIGQFGVPSTRGGPAAEPGLSGNAFSPTLVRAAGRVHLYHNDESTWGGVHRWTLQGVDDIVELRASGALGAALALRAAAP